MSKKKIAIIGTNGLPPSYGGFETLVNYLTIEKNREYDFTVFCPSTPREKQLKEYNGAKQIYLPFKANGGQSIIYDIVSILKALFFADSLLILGTPGGIIIPILKIFSSKKIIVNFGGLEWKREKWSLPIRWYLKLSESISVRFADVVVADNQDFVNYIKKHYKKTSVLIEYGGDHVRKENFCQEDLTKYPYLNKEYAVSVSRAQEDNNLHVLLAAYKANPDKILVLVSNWNKSNYGIELKKKYSGIPNIYIQDAIYDQKELNKIRGNAAIYIHTHKFCGTAPSLIEAMNLNIPVICFDMPTNRFTTEGKSIYFQTAEELSNELHNLTKVELSKLSRNMHEIALRRYSWEVISSKYADYF